MIKFIESFLNIEKKLKKCYYVFGGDYMSSNTKLFDVDSLDDTIIENTLKEVETSLKEVGYNPINQIVGYLMSGDPGYISSHNNSRKKIMKLDRNRIVELILREFLNKWEY